MNLPASIGLEHCLSFINCQLKPLHPGSLVHRNGAQRKAITISRQSGSGGHSVAARLTELLQARSPEGPQPWTVFDKNLVEKVLEDHHLPDRLAKFMPEDHISEISDTMDELFGLHPPSWTLVHKTAETILHLAELGNVILIGRGATVITSKLDYVFHVRLVGSFEKRVKYMQESEHLSAQTARALVRHDDLGRARFLKKYFGKDIDDPLVYHLIINTDLVSFDEAARMIADQVVPVAVASESHSTHSVES
jgi:cytidylate kinase